MYALVLSERGRVEAGGAFLSNIQSTEASHIKPTDLLEAASKFPTSKSRFAELSERKYSELSETGSAESSGIRSTEFSRTRSPELFENRSAELSRTRSNELFEARSTELAGTEPFERPEVDSTELPKTRQVELLGAKDSRLHKMEDSTEPIDEPSQTETTGLLQTSSELAVIAELPELPNKDMKVHENIETTAVTPTHSRFPGLPNPQRQIRLEETEQLEAADHTTVPFEAAYHVDELVEAVSHITEPVEAAYHATEPVETPYHTNELVEAANHSTKPVETAYHADEPVEAANHTTEPIEAAYYTDELVETAYHTTEPVETANHTDELDDTANHTTEPLEADGVTVIHEETSRKSEVTQKAYHIGDEVESNVQKNEFVENKNQEEETGNEWGDNMTIDTDEISFIGASLDAGSTLMKTEDSLTVSAELSSTSFTLSNPAAMLDISTRNQTSGVQSYPVHSLPDNRSWLLTMTSNHSTDSSSRRAFSCAGYPRVDYSKFHYALLSYVGSFLDDRLVHP